MHYSVNEQLTPSYGDVTTLLLNNVYYYTEPLDAKTELALLEQKFWITPANLLELGATGLFDGTEKSIDTSFKCYYENWYHQIEVIAHANDTGKKTTYRIYVGENDRFIINQSIATGSSFSWLGRKALRNQVTRAKDLGFSAVYGIFSQWKNVGGEQLNGGYTYARMGFELDKQLEITLKRYGVLTWEYAELLLRCQNKIKEFDSTMGSLQWPNGLMSTSAWRVWRKENAVDFPWKFDLGEWSSSWITLDAYDDEKDWVAMEIIETLTDTDA